MIKTLAMALLVWLVGNALTAAEPLAVGRLRDQNRFGDVANCGYRFANRPFTGADVLQWDLEETAWINMGGEDLALKLRESREVSGREEDASVGERSLLVFERTGTTITLETTVTALPDHEKCEQCSTRDEVGRITVRQGKRKWSAKIFGTCGS